MLGKCVFLKALPIIVARRISYHKGFREFQRIGILGIEVFRQFFHPDLKENNDLKLIRSKNGLCFKDITFTTEPSLSLINAFKYRILNNIQKYYARFLKNLPLVRSYAINKDMWNPICPILQDENYTKNLRLNFRK